jgi:hypothetical protein
MARIVQIPINFEFRRTRGEWREAIGEVIGWGGKDGLIDVEELRVNVIGLHKEIELGSGYLPWELYRECDRAGPNASDVEIQSICAGFKFQLFVDVASSTSLKETIGDAWLMRADLLRMKPNAQGVATFLQTWGRWDPPCRDYVLTSSILWRQKELKRTLLSGDDLGLVMLPLLNRIGEYPFLELRTRSCETAIDITVLVDVLRDVKFKQCARPDCAFVFALESNHRREYCDQYCAHLQSLRRKRHEAKSKIKSSGPEEG